MSKSFLRVTASQKYCNSQQQTGAGFRISHKKERQERVLEATFPWIRPWKPCFNAHNNLAYHINEVRLITVT